MEDSTMAADDAWDREDMEKAAYHEAMLSRGHSIWWSGLSISTSRTTAVTRRLLTLTASRTLHIGSQFLMPGSRLKTCSSARLFL
jgi:hypothetical protein